MIAYRYDNLATCASPVELRFASCLASLADLLSSTAPADNASSNRPHTLIPANTSAVTVLARPFASFGILDDSDDIALLMVPHILSVSASTAANFAATAAASEAAQSLSVRGLKPLLLATYHISSSDENTVRNAISILQQKIEADERKVNDAESDLENAKELLDAADQLVTQLQDKARRLGVANPETEGASSVLSSQLEEQATAKAAQDFRGAPWAMFAGGAAGNFDMLEPTPRVPWNSSRVAAYKGTAVAAARVTAGMGPLMLLGAIERNDVNHALMGFLGSKGTGMLAQSLEGQEQLEKLFPAMSHMELSNPRLVQNFRLRPGDEDSNHPQRPLIFSHLRTKFAGVLEMDGVGPRGGDGFVGMAVNLIHMPAPLQRVRVGVQHVAGRGGSSAASQVSYTLRQTLWYTVFQETMVFEDKPALDTFRRRCRDAGILLDQKIITLTGVRYNTIGVAWSSGVVPGQSLYSGELLMAQVPAHEQEAAPLDLRLVRAKVCSLIAQTRDTLWFVMYSIGG